MDHSKVIRDMESSQRSDRANSHHPTRLFRAAGVMAAVFVLTVFIMIAGLFSDPDLPINLWLNRYSLYLLLGEVGLLFVLSMLAMLTDRPSE